MNPTVWSPEGDMIAWNGGGEVRVMNADGSNRRLITDAPLFRRQSKLATDSE